ncbi:MAG: hypothetical protein JXQ29_00850 [Planctomycetes bacterium]|nr:hypothetical protein [Planctomycetota bacterium]
MKTVAWIAGCLCLLWTAAVAAAQVSLDLVDNDRRFAGTIAYTQFMKAPPEALVAEPPYRSDRRLYASLELGDGKDRGITLVLDEKGGAGTGYDTLYVDANNNNDLTDDAVIGMKSRKSGDRTMMACAPFDVTVKYSGGAERVLRVSVAFHSYAFQGMPEDGLEVACWYHLLQHVEGSVPLPGGEEVRMAIYDGGFGGPNGAFADIGADTLVIDRNGDRKLEGETPGPLSRVIRAKGALLALSVDPGAMRVEIAPYDGPWGDLKAVWKLSDRSGIVSGRVTLSDSRGISLEVDTAAGQAVAFPAGDYAITMGRIEVKDAAGVVYTAEVASQEKVTSVKAGEQAELELGAPFTLRPVIEGAFRTGQYAQISSVLLGASGEEYSSVTANGRGERPRVQVLDAEGIEVAAGKMEHG